MEGNMVEGKNDDKSNKKYEAIRKKLDNQAKKHVIFSYDRKTY